MSSVRSNKQKAKRRAKTKARRNNTNARSLGPGDYRFVSGRLGGFPDSMVTTLAYADTVNLTAASPYSSYVFRGNSLYDPDYTSTGHQPRYFDTLMGVYNKYKVIGLRYKLTVMNASSAIPSVVICPLTQVLSSGAAAIQFAEYARAKLLGPLTAVSIKNQSVSDSLTTEGVCGLSKAQLAAEDWSGTSLGSPAQNWYLNILVVTPGGTNVDMKISVVLEYTALFYDRDEISPSLKEYVVESPEWDPVKRERTHLRPGPAHTEDPALDSQTAAHLRKACPISKHPQGVR